MINRVESARGQESVWDYPRPPAIRGITKRIRIFFNNLVIVESVRVLQILETSHPPCYYIPPDDIQMQYLIGTSQRSFCEFKGQAHYWTIQIGERQSINAAWSYPDPKSAYQAIKNYLAFYPGRVDACFVDDEQVQAQAGGFYGGWITANVVGPFKGSPGTERW